MSFFSKNANKVSRPVTSAPLVANSVEEQHPTQVGNDVSPLPVHNANVEPLESPFPLGEVIPATDIAGEVTHVPVIYNPAGMLRSFYFAMHKEHVLLPDSYIMARWNGNILDTIRQMKAGMDGVRPTQEQLDKWAEEDEFLSALSRLDPTGSALDEYGDYSTDGTSSDSGDADSRTDPGLDTTTASIMEGISVTLDPSQDRAVIGLVRESHGCLIGAAGTGKTTTTKVLVHTLMNGSAEWGIEALRMKAVDIDAYHERDKKTTKKKDAKARGRIPSIAMVAFTGQATQVLKKNLPKSWHHNVMTIHLLLGFGPVPYIKPNGETGMRFEPSYDKFNLMPWDVIVVDEASMVAIDLWHMVLDASKPGCRFYFIGDLNQLPPTVGKGILGFALSKWPVFELTVVHRQADDAANRIVDTAHRILNGKLPEFDDDKKPGWRVAGFKLSSKEDVAHEQICGLAKRMAAIKVDPSNPESPAMYDPFRDRIMVAMNGFNRETAGWRLGQDAINDTLSQIFAAHGSERTIIDAKRAVKRFAPGYRVMATKNEPPGLEDRVTNGLTGRIMRIDDNPDWIGDRRLVGLESVVKQNRFDMVASMESRHDTMEKVAESVGHKLESFVFSAPKSGEKTVEERQGGPASHIVSIQFDNGGFREYRTNATVESIRLAYASTVHKAQGAEMPMAIVVMHHLQRKMLTRELFYTAVTRASQRVLILYTEMGMNIALATQKISGNTLAEKIRQYQELMLESEGGKPSRFSFSAIKVRLEKEDVVEDDDESIEEDEEEAF